MKTRVDKPKPVKPCVEDYVDCSLGDHNPNCNPGVACFTCGHNRYEAERRKELGLQEIVNPLIDQPKVRIRGIRFNRAAHHEQAIQQMQQDGVSAAAVAAAIEEQWRNSMAANGAEEVA